jgi:hypothetical protein
MKGKITGRITVKDYIKAVKKADRAIGLENSSGFKAVTKVHKSKKAYNRKEGKKSDFEPSFFCAIAKLCTPTYFIH